MRLRKQRSDRLHRPIDCRQRCSQPDDYDDDKFNDDKFNDDHDAANCDDPAHRSMTRERPRLHGERGSGLIEFSIFAPVLLAVIGLAMFTAHIYEVKSDLQRVAERAAKYAAAQCDPRNKTVFAACTSNGYHTAAQIQTYAKTAFHNTNFVLPASGCARSKTTPVVCVAYAPTRSDSPVPSQQVTVTLLYTYDEPFVGFLRAVSLQSSLVDLTGHGDSAVE